MASGEKVKVAVRVRPLNRREIELGTKCVVEMQESQTVIHHPSEQSRGKQPKVFAYDHCFWSCSEEDAHYASQSNVFDCLGYELLDNAFDGYNACILAYGQTGSGKSYSMMGTSEQAGIIPRFCNELFGRIEKSASEQRLFKVEVSYMEIYNEKVRDLLDPKGNKHSLRVREHALLGPYVDGLSVLAVSSLEQMQELMEEGNKSRTVAATNMNAESSRSHAVFTIRMSQTLVDEASGATGERASKISLVDLAGSERAEKTGAMGERLREGGSINKSLTTLGLVISALAEQASTNALQMATSMTTSISTMGKQKKKFVPYRDSVLTWLLKDSLGGNSKTVMIATISPAADNYEESLSTLRYADRAKRIVNHAVVNEDPNAKIIRELRTEVDQLKAQLVERNVGEPDLRERLMESEKLVTELSRSWEERLKETERVHQDRQSFLEKMGISVQTSGIKVEKEKFYLVNLNADPAMNELLVYYLKEHTLVGSPAAPTEVDIVLEGLGIAPLHACIGIQTDPPPQSLFIEPLENARTLVNGSMICSKTILRHGDRLLMGNNHFFRVNCPISTASTNANSNSNYAGSISQQNLIDYGFAQEEVTNKEMTNDPVAATIAVLEKQHQLDKEAALEKQRRMYEQQIIALKSQCVSPMTPSYDFVTAFGGAGAMRTWSAAGSTPSTPSTFPLSNVQTGYVQWARERDAMFKKSLSKLKEDIVRANSMAREANLMATDMGKQTVYSVTLQIPASNLTPKRIRTGAFISEPAVLVRRKGKGSQLWSMDKLENKLIDMREVYGEWKGESISTPSPVKSLSTLACADPFYESQETHSLIGVANVFLEVLFHDVKLDYHVPIISQQGEVSGRLHVEIYRIKTQLGQIGSGEMDEKIMNKDDSMSDACSTSSSSSLSLAGSFFGKNITCRVRIKSASGLPPSLSHFVFCQYNFWSNFDPTVVPPVFDPNEAKSNTVHKPESLVFRFDHQKDFEITVTDEFLEYVQEDALSIQVWGHKSTGFTPMLQLGYSMVNGANGGEPLGDSSVTLPKSIAMTGNAAVDASALGVRTLRERWSEVSRRLRLWVEIHELNDQGKYAPVPVSKAIDAGSGGAYHLRQGQQRRIVVDVGTAEQAIGGRQVDQDQENCIGSYGSLPVVCQRILGVSIGCVCVRNKNMQKSLDSYQDLDLESLRQRWMEALDHRRTYLDNQIQRLINKPDKSEVDVEREQSLIAQWVTLTEERNAVHVPAPDSNLPGAPAEERVPPMGVEKHIPVIFLDLKDDATTGASSSSTSISANSGGASTVPVIVGAQSILPKEQSGKMFTLPLFRADADTPETRAVASWDSSIHEHTALNKTTLAQERVYAILKVVVRLSHPAEIDLHLRKRLCFTVIKPPSFAERLFKRIIGTDALTGTGVYYDLVSHIPKSSFDPEARETLALIAARSDSVDGVDGESYIERYTRGISEVESILALDRLRQELVIRELLNAGLKSGLKRATSMPLSDRISMMGLPTSRSDSVNLAEQARCGGGPGQLVIGLNSPNVIGGPSQAPSCLPSVQEEQAGQIEQQQKNGAMSPQFHEASLVGPASEEAASADSSGYGSQLCLGHRSGPTRAFDEQEELTEQDTPDQSNRSIQQQCPTSAGSRNFPKLPLDNSTSFSEYEAHLLETSIISTELKSSLIQEENKEISESTLCDQNEQ